MFKQIVNHVNDSIEKFVNSSTYIPLGPTYKTFTDANFAEYHLIRHRMASKFLRPLETNNDLHTSAIIAMVEYDKQGIVNFEKKLKELRDPEVRSTIYKARNILHEVLRFYHLDYSTLCLPSGETLRSAGGDVSIYAKLRDRSQWCVTPECFDLFARVCYNTPGLKAAARRHFKMWSKEQNKKFDNRSMYLECKKHNLHLFNIFKAKLRCIVTFVGYARLTTVPKNNETNRVIECDSFCNMVVQLAIDAGIKKAISKRFGLKLKRVQDLHRLMLKDRSLSTIDFSKASDSTWLSVIQWFMKDTKLLHHLIQSRSPIVEYEDSNGINYHELRMLSPMGNGFTFSVMTLLLLCISRVHDSLSSCFGDDVILSTTVADICVKTYEFIGYRVNIKKTFIDSAFRESCGGFYLDRYLHSYDFWFANDIVDAIVNINKVFILKSLTKDPQLEQLHRTLIEGIPLHLHRGVPPIKDSSVFNRYLPKSIYDPNFREGDNIYLLYALDRGIFLEDNKLRRLQKKDKVWAQKVRSLRSRLAAEYSVPIANIASTPYTYIKRVNRKYLTKSGRPRSPRNNVNSLYTYFYLYSGRCDAPTVRETRLRRVSELW